MDADRFDRFVSSLVRPATRRAALRAAAAGGLGAGLAALGLRQDAAAACKKNGKECDKDKAEQCCSGTCQKKGGKNKCVKADGAFGCTNEKKNDACERNEVDCPNKPSGFCVVDEKKRPFCAGRASCRNCQNDQFCRDDLRDPKARCIKQCGACAGETGGRACVAPPGSAVPVL